MNPGGNEGLGVKPLKISTSLSTSAIFYAVPIGDLASSWKFSYGVPIGEKAASRPGYVGAAFLDQDIKEATTELDIICEAKGPEATLAIKPALRNGSPVWPDGSIQVD